MFTQVTHIKCKISITLTLANIFFDTNGFKIFLATSIKLGGNKI